MRVRMILVVAFASLLAATAATALPLPVAPTGDLWVSDDAYFARIDMDDVANPYLEGRWHRSAMSYVDDIAFDGNGHAVASLQGAVTEPPHLAVFDQELEMFTPVGSVELPARLRDIAVRNQTQVLGCHGDRYNEITGQYEASLSVFDISDSANPSIEFTQTVASPWSNLGIGCGISFDADGQLWMSGHHFFSAFNLDEAGAVIGQTDHWLSSSGGNPELAVFQPGSDLVFYGAYNADFIGVRNRTDMSLEVGRITDVCGIAPRNVSRMAFDSNGNLVVSCAYGAHGEGYPDLVVFPAAVVDGYTGEQSRSELDHFAFYDDALYSTRVLEFAPVADPVVLIGELVSKVEELNLQQGISNSLDAKLQNAVKALDDVNDNNDAAAIETLEGFINEVEAQAGKQIPQADAQALIAMALKIITLLR